MLESTKIAKDIQFTNQKYYKYDNTSFKHLVKCIKQIRAYIIIKESPGCKTFNLIKINQMSAEF